MPRAIWTGAISFGLVNVPIKLFTATEEKDIGFHQFQERTGQRIRNKRVAEKSGREVDYEDIVKGYEVKKGQFVIVEPEELEAVAPQKTKAIDIEDFVDIDAIDPIYFQKTYYIGPDGTAARKAYALLREAMQKAGKVAVARFVMRSKEYLVTLRPRDDILLLHTMFFADEVREPGFIESKGSGKEPTPKELKIATQLIDSLTADWEPKKYRDTYRKEVLELIERKAKGEEIVTTPVAEEPTKVVDLLEALEASIADARQRKTGANKKASASRKKKAS